MASQPISFESAEKPQLAGMNSLATPWLSTEESYSQEARAIQEPRTLRMANETRGAQDYSVIGPYRILRPISQGGMGVVYLAARNDDEFNQRVAIKLVKVGMDSEFFLRRFRDERQILAALNHPNIARLFDGGHTSDGRPYLVMEYIEGKPIMQYADEHRLSTEDRLHLFKVVCGAVHYAHQNLVIHRDIKPVNILVLVNGIPKLLDFGIAKLLNPEIAGHPLEATEVGMRLMTPEYASPEQVRGETITTASDVYSLGVLLYELLTGHQPYRVNDNNAHEIEQIVCEKEPPRPSAMVGLTEVCSGEGESPVVLTPEIVSRTRKSSPDKLRRRLTGDLDNIILMAMRKEPSRRYASVDQLAGDIQRHLEGRPIIARRDTLTYRASKFVRRHQLGIVAALIVMASFVIGTAITMQQRAQAEQQRARAEQKHNEVRQLIGSFMQYQDGIKDLPGSTAAREKIASDVLEKLDNLARDARNDQQVQRELALAYQRVGDVQGNPFENNLGNRLGALASYQKALAILHEISQQNPSELDNRRALAVVHLRIGQVSFSIGNKDVAIEFLQKGLNIIHSLAEEGQLDLATSRALPNAHRTLAYALSRKGNPRAALDSVNKGRALIEKLIAAHPNDTEAQNCQNAMNRTLGETWIDLGGYPAGLATLNSVRDFDQNLVNADPTNIPYKIALATDHWKVGDAELLVSNPRAAVASFRSMLAIMEQVVAGDQKNVRAENLRAIAQIRLGRALGKNGDFQESLLHQQRAATFFRKVAAREPSSAYAQIQMAYTDVQLSVALARTGQAGQAVELGEKAQAVAAKLTAAEPTNVELRGANAGICSMFGDVHMTLAMTKLALATKIDHWRAARHWYQRSDELLKELKGQGHWTDKEYGTLEEMASKIAKCDAAMAKLHRRKN